jgi:hypothetical protein
LAISLGACSATTQPQSIHRTSTADMNFEKINHLVIDCNIAKAQYSWLEEQRSDKVDKLTSAVYTNTRAGQIYAEFTGKRKWAYTTRSGLRNAVIDLKQSQIRDHCFTNVPIGY